MLSSTSSRITCPPLPLLQLLFYFDQQIGCIVFVDIQVCIAQNAKTASRLDMHPGKQRIQKLDNQRFQQDINVFSLLLDRDQARQYSRYFNQGKVWLRSFPAVIRLLHRYVEMQGFIADQRKGSVSINSNRVSGRDGCLTENIFQPLDLLAAQLLCLAISICSFFSAGSSERL